MSVAAEICSACGRASLVRRGFCPFCGSGEIALGSIASEGVIWSVTQIHRPPSSAGGASDPYSVALIALVTGERLMARVPEGVAIGQPVSVTRGHIDDPDTQVILRDI